MKGIASRFLVSFLCKLASQSPGIFASIFANCCGIFQKFPWQLANILAKWCSTQICLREPPSTTVHCFMELQCQNDSLILGSVGIQWWQSSLPLVIVISMVVVVVVVVAHHLFTTTNQLVSLCYELDLELPKWCAIVDRAKDYCTSISITTDLCCHHWNLQCVTINFVSWCLPWVTNLYMAKLCWMTVRLKSIKVCAGWKVTFIQLESTILAIQDHVVATRVIEAKIMKKHWPSLMCRLCGESEETILFS